MTKLSLLAAVAAGALLPQMAAAQTMPDMPGMTPQPAQTTAPVTTPTPAPAEMPMDHIRMDHGASPALAPVPGEMDHQAMDHMNHGAAPDTAMSGMAGMAGMAVGEDFTGGSGTSRLPAAEGAMHGLHLMAGDWMFMLHGYVWGTYSDQGGPRGGKEAFATSMAMVTASHDIGDRAHFQFRTMMSLEPALGPKGYPNLFATGETANGRNPLIDRQHPHDLFMELSTRLDYDIGRGSAFLYAAPVGEPALGPSAFMHRASAQYESLSPITHHWFDSTHISYGVVTAGYSAPHWQLEASAFHGREPDEHRWDIEAPALDSWSVRATWNPTPEWQVQVSHGFLKSPEQLEPDANDNRTTATVQYAHKGLSTTFGFAAKDLGRNRTLTAWLAEANWDLTKHHTIFGRVENVANDELFPDNADPLHDQRFRVTKAEGGYAYRLKLVGPFRLALGGSVAGYVYPAALDGAYGAAPISYTLFAKLSLGH